MDLQDKYILKFERVKRRNLFKRKGGKKDISDGFSAVSVCVCVCEFLWLHSRRYESELPPQGVVVFINGLSDCPRGAVQDSIPP